MKKKTILIVHNFYQIPGGEDTVVANEKKMLEDHGHKVIMYSRHNSELKKMRVFRKLMLPFTTIFNVKTYYDIVRKIKKEKIDVIHVHNTLSLISPAVYYAGIAKNVPVVQTMHNFRLICPGAELYHRGNICEKCISEGICTAIKYSCYRDSKIQTLICVINTLIHRWLGIYKRIYYICLTEFNKEKILAIPGIKANQIFIKPNFTFDPQIEKNEGKYFLFIGRMEKIKGVDIVLEAFARIRNEKLILAGTGSCFEEYKTRYSVNSNISFVGQLKRDDLNGIIKHAKAVIVASQWYETFGMIVAESFAAKTPVIVGDIGNVSSLVADGINGIKFKYNSIDALVDAIKRFDSLDYKKMSQKAYEKYEECFSDTINYEMLDQIYNQLCNNCD